MLLAMDDYAAVLKIDPSRCDALIKRGLYFFREKLWPSVIETFNQVMDNPEQQALARSLEEFMLINKTIAAILFVII